MQQSSGALHAAPAVRGPGGARVAGCVVRWLAVASAAVLAGGLAASLMPDIYTARATLALSEGRGLAPVGDSPSAAAAIIASPDLAREVVGRLGPDAAAKVGASPFHALAVSSGVARWLESAPLPSARPLASADERALEAYRNALDLEPRDGAGVLVIGVAAGSADVAAMAANETAKVYLERRAAAVTERDQALAGAVEGVARAQEALSQALDRSAAFRADPAASDTARRAQAAVGDLALLVAERAALAIERDAIARRLLSVENLRGSGDLFDVPSEGAHLLRHLVEQRLTLRADLAAERRIREARDWRVRALAARADDLDSQIEAASGSARDWLERERGHLDRRIAELEGAIHLRQAIAAAAADNDRRQSGLDHAVSEARDRLGLARERLHDEAERVRFGASAARVLTIAEAPQQRDPVYPAVAGVVAALLAGAAAWGIVGRRRQGRGGVDIGRAASATSIADPGIPARSGDVETSSPVSSPAAIAVAPAPLPAAGSPLVSVRVAETGGNALESLLTRLAIAPRAEGGRHLAVIGAGDDSVSAAVARALARHLARSERVVLLDLVTPGETSGFADLVAGTASFSEIITREPGSRLHHIAHGRAALSAETPGDTMLLALAALDQTYDWIIENVPVAGGPLGEKLLARAQGVVLAAAGDGVDFPTFSAYEALREKGVVNIVVGLGG